MKTVKQQIFDILKFFMLFYVTSVLLQLTYSISFYISDIIHIFNAPLKISFIFMYSIVLGLYFTFHVLYNVKVMRILCFLSVLFALFYLQDFHGNILFKYMFSAEISYFLFILYLIAGVTAMTLGIIADVFQIVAAVKTVTRDPKRIARKERLNETLQENQDEYFV
ncbi:MAG: hypothetical protein J6B11_06690 [Spirochaetales bacterium]|nr:hypothetical protein [Spirochaetales bacterium]